MRSNFCTILLLGFVALEASLMLQISTAEIAEVPQGSKSTVVQKTTLPKTIVKGTPKIRRTVRMREVLPPSPTEEPTTTEPPKPAAPVAAPVNLSNTGSTNQVEVKPDISISTDQKAAPESGPKPQEIKSPNKKLSIVPYRARKRFSNQKAYGTDPQEVNDNRQAVQPEPVVASTKADNQVAEVNSNSGNAISSQSDLANNQLNKLVTNSGNVANNVSADSNNAKNVVIRNAGNSEVVHLEGVGNSKVTRIANSGNSEITQLDDGANKTLVKVSEVKCDHPDHKHDNGPPKASQQPIVQINFNGQQPNGFGEQPKFAIPEVSSSFIVPIMHDHQSMIARRQIELPQAKRLRIGDIFRPQSEFALVQRSPFGSLHATPISFAPNGFGFQQPLWTPSVQQQQMVPIVLAQPAWPMMTMMPTSGGFMAVPQLAPHRRVLPAPSKPQEDNKSAEESEEKKTPQEPSEKKTTPEDNEPKPVEEHKITPEVKSSAPDVAEHKDDAKPTSSGPTQIASNLWNRIRPAAKILSKQEPQEDIEWETIRVPKRKTKVA